MRTAIQLNLFREHIKERDEISIIMNFVTFLLFFFTLLKILKLIPFSGDILAFLAKLVIFVIIVQDLGTFSQKITEFLIQINQTQKAKYNVNIQGDSNVDSFGIIEPTGTIFYKYNQDLEKEKNSTII